MVRPKRILCPIDFSRASRRALQFAVALAEERDAHVTVLHVGRRVALFPALVAGIDSRQHDAATARLMQHAILAVLTVEPTQVSSPPRRDEVVV